MTKPVSILFVCTANSARSQMAEGFARFYAGDRVEIDSAGTHPTRLNPYAVEVMSEVGIDISGQTSDSLAGKNLNRYQYLVTLCGQAEAACPVLPPSVAAEHWGLSDPAAAVGERSDIIAGFRAVRSQIEQRVKEILGRIPSGHSPTQ